MSSGFQIDDDGNLQNQKIISRTEPLASLTLQLILLFDKHIISNVFFVLVFCLGFYKVFKFNLKQYNLEIDILILIFLYITNQFRLYIAVKSNKIERASWFTIIIFIFLTLGCIAAFIYFLILQNFALLIEWIVVILCLLLALLELVIMIAMFIDFKSLENS